MPNIIETEFSAVWLAHVLWEHGVAGSNPAIPIETEFIQD